MRRLALIAAVVAPTALARVAAADPDLEMPGPRSVEAGLFLGGFISNYYHQFYDTSIMNRQLLDPVSPELGGRFAYFPSPWFGGEAEGSVVLTSTQMTGDSAQIYQGRVQLMAQIPRRVTPFVAAGIGVAHLTSDPTVLGSATHFPIHAGIGAKFYATKSMALRADLRLLRGPSEQAPYTLNASYGEFSIGISWVPGGADIAAPPPDPDPDHDGVIGEADQCPEQPGPVENNGCPDKDIDGDGIVDRLDKCPNDPETVNGFQDQDGCPDVIPDHDNDGIDDLHDKCPNEAEDKDGFQDADGCPDPDNDGDGVLDAADKCPNVAGPVENGGCPDVDSDGDGIVDRLDNCPNEPGTAENHGCKAKQLVVITKNQLQILDKVYFQTGSAKLLARSNPLLDNIVRVLDAHPEIKKLKIDGHTDNVGRSELNQRLSDARAAAVMAYFVKKGIAAERLDAVGHGDTVPLDTNDTAKGREANRRVEFNIITE